MLSICQALCQDQQGGYSQVRGKTDVFKNLTAAQATIETFAKCFWNQVKEGLPREGREGFTENDNKNFTWRKEWQPQEMPGD